MSGLVRLTSVWTGFIGAPGYTNMYARHNGVSAQDVADQFADDIHDFWAALNTYLPDDVGIYPDPTWASIDEATGQILAEGSLSAAPATVYGLSGASFAGNAGMAVDWHTDAFVAGHRLRGRTFVVPAVGCFGAGGQLDSIARQALIDAATALYDNSSIMVVWHRPVSGAGGSSSEITSVTVTNRAAILRSRSV